MFRVFNFFFRPAYAADMMDKIYLIITKQCLNILKVFFVYQSIQYDILNI